MKLGMQVGLGSKRLCVRWRTRSPLPKRGWSPKFLAHVYCRQTAGWIKMVLGMEVGLSPGDLVVLDGDRPPPQKGGRSSPQFLAHVYCRQTAGWIKMPLGTEVGLNPGHVVLDGDPAPPRKGVQQPPTFRLMFIVAKRSPISATAKLL